MKRLRWRGGNFHHWAQPTNRIEFAITPPMEGYDRRCCHLTLKIKDASGVWLHLPIPIYDPKGGAYGVRQFKAIAEGVWSAITEAHDD